MDAKTQKALTDYAVANWDFPASAAEELKRVIDRKEAEKVHICPTCRNTGKIDVSYADSENGPTNDPEDEHGIESCECAVGYQVWLRETEAVEAANAAFFAEMEWERKTERLNR